MKAFGFGKTERLKRRKHIEVLFAEGRSVSHAPVRIKYLFSPLPEGIVPVQAGVSVGRRAFKRAVHRNRLKRLMREAYRLQKPPLVTSLSEKGVHAELFLIYTGKTLVSFDVIQEAVTSCLRQLLQKAIRYHENPD